MIGYRTRAVAGLSESSLEPGRGKRVQTEETPVPQSASAIVPDDALLVRQTQQGDMAAFSRLVGKYQDRVYNVCWRLCGNVEDARDLAQDAFLKALEAIGRFEQRSQFYTWIYRIAVNLALSHRRRARPTVQLSLHNEDGSRLIGAQAAELMRRAGSSDPDDPAECAATKETHRLLLQALEELDADQRAILVLRDIESLDYREIAEVLEVAPGTVKSRLHRARMALREKMLPVLKHEA